MKKLIAGISAAVLCGTGIMIGSLLVNADTSDYMIKAEYPVDFTCGGYYVDGGAKLELSYYDSTLTVELTIPDEIDAKEDEDISFGSIAYNLNSEGRTWQDVWFDENSTGNRFDRTGKITYDERYYFSVLNRYSIIEPQTVAKIQFTNWNVGDAFALGDYEYYVDDSNHFVRRNTSDDTGLKNHFEPTPLVFYGPGFPISKTPCISHATCAVMDLGTGDFIDTINIRNETTFFSNGAVRVQTFMEDPSGGVDFGCERALRLGFIDTSRGYMHPEAEASAMVYAATETVDETFYVTGTINGVVTNDEMLCEVNFFLEQPMTGTQDSVDLDVYGSSMCARITDGSMHYDVEDDDDPLTLRREEDFYERESDAAAVEYPAPVTAAVSAAVQESEAVQEPDPETPPMPTEDEEEVLTENPPMPSDEDGDEEELPNPDLPAMEEEEEELDQTPPMPEDDEEELENPDLPEQEDEDGILINLLKQVQNILSKS